MLAIHYVTIATAIPPVSLTPAEALLGPL